MHMNRRDLFLRAGATALVLPTPAIVRAASLMPVKRPPIIIEKTTYIATLVVRIPDIDECPDYVPGNPGEFIWRREDGSEVDLVVTSMRADASTHEWSRQMVGNPVRTLSERMLQAVTWVRDTGALNGIVR